MSQQWVWRSAGECHGPVSSVELELLLQSQIIGDADEVQIAGAAEWIAADVLRDIFAADGDDSHEARGFKIAHGFYRGPHEDDLVTWLTDSYARSTGLPWDPAISEDMTDYYAFAWFRYEHALSPFTPAAVLEMGFL